MTFDHRDEDFRVGFSTDFVDDHGALSFPDIPGLAREFLREYRLDYVPDGVNQTFGKSADVNGNLLKGFAQSRYE